MMPTPGIIALDAVPDPVPHGLIENCEAALQALGFTPFVTMAPDGLHCADVPTVTAQIASYAGSPAHLDWLKSGAAGGGLKGDLTKVYAGKLAAGRVFAGRTFQVDDASQIKIAGMATLAGFVAAGVPGMAWPDGFGWIADDNSVMALTAAQMLAFGQDVANYVSALVLHNRELKDAIVAAVTVEELQAIDITAGWPANS